jgi:hypothetical protein
MRAPSGQPIFIQFTHANVADLFSELLHSRGIPTEVLKNEDPAPKTGRLITESRYFEGLSADVQEKCLLVGDRSQVRRLSTLYLDTPLTEAKVERALGVFLSE